jgi:hypothetical protein
MNLRLLSRLLINAVYLVLEVSDWKARCSDDQGEEKSHRLRL